MPETQTRDHTQTINALLQLSGFTEEASVGGVGRMVAAIKKAPDPETACQVITAEFGAEGALEQKWREVISKTWLDFHPNAAADLKLPLTSEDVVRAPLVKDARAILDELLHKPASLVQDKDGYAINPRELPRLLAAIPSLHYDENIVAEHEWGYVPLRRLRSVLQELRLLRVYQGKLAVVVSRYNKFMDMPLPQQFYVLWHADVYHVDWGEFAHAWHKYFHAMQHYLPLLWDVSEGAQVGQLYNTRDITRVLINVFGPIWQQEGLYDANTNTQMLFRAYEQHTLPAALERMIIHDLFIRHGIFETEGSLLNILQPAGGINIRPEGSTVRLTNLGHILLNAEREDDLPCGIDILK